MKPYRAPWEYDVAPFEIVEGVYYVGNSNVSSHLFDTGEGLLLLDTTYGETGYLLLESIRELGFDPHNIRWIVHSHAHYDHFGATRYLMEKFGCQTYMPQKDMPFMTDAEMTCCAGAGLKYEPPYDYYFDVDVQMRHGESYTFGNITMEVYDAPGHTPGTMAYIFNLPSGLRLGMHGGIGLNTQTSDYAREHGLGDSWRRAYAQTLVNLRQLQMDVVLGNHPSQNHTFAKAAAKTKDHNPFIDPGYWQEFLDTTQQKFRELLENDPI